MSVRDSLERIQRCCTTLRKQKKFWELLPEKFDRFQTLRNNIQQHEQGVQTDATCNIQQCCVRLHGALHEPAFALTTATAAQTLLLT